MTTPSAEPRSFDPLLAVDDTRVGRVKNERSRRSGRATEYSGYLNVEARDRCS